jgi:hypothetical protein
MRTFTYSAVVGNGVSAAMHRRRVAIAAVKFVLVLSHLHLVAKQVRIIE